MVLPWRKTLVWLGSLGHWPPSTVTVGGDIPPQNPTLSLNSLKTTELYH